MSILTQLRKLEKDLTGYKTQRETALKSYQDLYPEYKTAVTAAKEMGTQVADSYGLNHSSYLAFKIIGNSNSPGTCCPRLMAG